MTPVGEETQFACGVVHAQHGPEAARELGPELAVLLLLLGLEPGLALVVGELGLALEGLVRAEFLLFAGGGILADGLVDGFVKLLKTVCFNIGIDVDICIY